MFRFYRFGAGLLFTGSLLAIAQTAHAVTATWQNGGNLLWGNTANWSTGAVPSPVDTVLLQSTPSAGVNAGAIDLGGATRTITAMTTGPFIDDAIPASAFLRILLGAGEQVHMACVAPVQFQHQGHPAKLWRLGRHVA